MEKLKGLKLIELKLEGNPFVERLEASYTRYILTRSRESGYLTCIVEPNSRENSDQCVRI